MSRLLLVLPLALLTACQTPPAVPAPAEAAAVKHELRVHDVPDGYGPQLTSQLSRILKDQGRVTTAPNGDLLVVAPASIQEGVAKLVADVSTQTAAAPSNVRIDYWIVSGRPAEASVREHAALKAIAPALDAIDARLGPQQFILYGTHSVSSLDGFTGKVRTTHPMSIRQTASVSPQSGTVVADIEIETRHGDGASIETRLQVEPDKLVVLGEVGNAGPETMYFVIRPVIE